MTMLSSYMDKVHAISRDSDVHIRRINQRYINRGWTIIYGNNKIREPIQGNCISKALNQITSTTQIESMPPVISTIQIDSKKEAFQSLIETNKSAKSALTKRYDALFECASQYKLIDADFMIYLFETKKEDVEIMADNMISYIQRSR